jgi:cell division protein FtsZ
VHDAVDCVREELDADANIIFGATLDEALAGKIRVSIVASGMARTQAEAHKDRPAHRSDHTQGGASTGRDYRARLSEAIGSYGASDQSQGNEAAQGEEWRSAEDVVIREGLQQRPAQAENRPMPAIGDFPPPAQREYWAKAGDNRTVQQQPERPARRPGLLQRLTGGGRDKRAEPNRPRRSDGPVLEEPHEQVDLPVFFGRDRRK